MRRSEGATASWWTLLIYVLVLASCAHVAGPAAEPSKAKEAAILLPESATVFLGCGFLLAEHHGATVFSAVLAGDEMKQVKSDGSVILLDGVLVQVTVAPASEIGAPTLRGTDLLQRHMLWEAKYVTDAKNWPALHPGGDPIDLGLGDIKTMIWGYDAPELFEVEGVKMNRTMYVTAAIDDFVLTLGAPMRPEDDARHTGRVLFRSMRTLRREAAPIDIFAISAAAQAGKPSRETCSRVGAL
jgi:hypothetical protein